MLRNLREPEIGLVFARWTPVDMTGRNSVAELKREVILPDGRILAYARFGHAAGHPIIYCHGSPASRMEASVFDKAADELGIAVFAPDRPGLGYSQFIPERSILGWADDVRAVADALGIDRFAVLASSGGSAYALACAYRLPQRVTRVGVCGPVGPLSEPQLVREIPLAERFIFHLARRSPTLFAAAFLAPSQLLQRFPALASRLKKEAEPDKKVLAQPEVRQILDWSLQGALRQGVLGITVDVQLLTLPWGFSVEDISVPAYFWHGLQDVTVPPIMSEFLASRMPAGHLSLVPNEGHISLVVNTTRHVLETMRG